MHEPVSYENLWLFIIISIIFFVALFFITPKLMSFLDKLADRRTKKNENQPKRRMKKV